MNKKTYKLMNWPEIESIIYSDGDRPDTLLGAHNSGSGVLIQTFAPDVNKVSVVLGESGTKIPMELADEDGFYACFIPNIKEDAISYHYEVTDRTGAVSDVEDCYRFPSYFEKDDEKSFASGISYELYRKLGSHLMEYDGKKGTFFAVYAPSAARVSVIGSFNNWDGRINQMSRLDDTDIFEIFIPGVKADNEYQYEIKNRHGISVRKSDPFAFETGNSPLNASVVTTLKGYKWTDKEFVASRAERRRHNAPLSVYEFDISAFSSFEKACAKLPSYVRSLGFTAVMFRPFSSDSNSVYAPDKRLGRPADLMGLVDAFHAAGLEVIFKWNPVKFTKSDTGLSGFDLSPVFESADSLRAETPDGKSHYFDLGNPRVSDFLLANAFFMVELYHADGIATDDLAPMLYLDYGKQETGYTPNMYGGVENLDAVEFLKHLNSMMDTRNPGTIMIAEETAAWQGVTGHADNDKLGFTYKLHDNFRNSLLRYISTDPLFREGVHELLLEDMVYQYTEKFMIPLGSKDVGPDASAILTKMPGDNDLKYANLRLLVSEMMLHPGTKLLNLGETLSDITEESDSSELSGLRKMVCELNRMYAELPAMSQNDERPDGFEWLRQMSNPECMLCFMRKGSHPNDFILILFNNANAEWKTKIGVPYAGKYKEIFNSQQKLFGGNITLQRAKTASECETDGRAYALGLTVAPLSAQVFTYSE